jgi:small basic protein (TIGR04137 family)
MRFTEMAGGIMSRHSSLKKIGGGTTEKRTVLTRYERIALLRKRGQWSDGQRITGLLKTKPEE